jgi:proliferating cell nuclear antigen PCNA
MHLQTVHGKSLAAIFNIARLFYQNINITFNKSGMHMCQMDASRVLLTSMFLDANDVDLKTDRAYHIRIDVRNALSFLKNIEHGNATKFELRNKPNEDPQALWLSIYDGVRRGSVMNFKIPLSGKAQPLQHVPNLADWAYVISLPTKLLHKKLSALEILDKTVRIRMTPTSLTFEAKSLKGEGGATLTFAKASPARSQSDSQNTQKTSPVYLIKHNNQTIESTFELKLILNLAKGTNLNETVTLSMSHHMPLHIHYEVQDIGTISFMLGSKDVVQQPAQTNDIDVPATTGNASSTWSAKADALNPYSL